MVKTISMKEKWKTLQCNVFIDSVSLIFVSDLENEGQEIWEVASLICDNVVLNVVQSEVKTFTVFLFIYRTDPNFTRNIHV